MKMKIHSVRQICAPLATVAALAMTLSAFSTKAEMILGPLDPGFENGGQNWNSGASGSSSLNFVNFSNPGTNGPSAPGGNCVMEASDGAAGDTADLRSDYFSLGMAAAGSNSISIDFDYNILGPFTNGDQIRVGCRFEDSNGNFLGEHNFHLGTPNNDVGGAGWHHFHGVAADPTLSAVNMDVRITMNVFGDDVWHSGPVLYDNFTVRVTPDVGVNNNGDFENFSANWNAGGPGGSAGSESFNNPGTNGPSEPGDNSVEMTSDGSVNPPGGNDLRVNNFYLGPASRGSNGVSVDFDYNILTPIYSGDEIRVGLRFEDSNGNFLGEHNFHLGAPNNDPGGNGWHHFHGVASDPTLSAVTADLRLSMNIFGDDIWGSGPIVMDNFVVKATPVIGPNNNGDFENGSANWNSGGPNSSGGFNTFFYGPGTNGLSAPGTNCAMMTADGTVQPPNGNDIRVNEFNVSTNNGQPVTLSFDYNILNAITSSPNQVRVDQRFFDSNNNFVGEHITHIGLPNGDVGGNGWHHLSATYPIVPGSVYSDIQCSMNKFGDDLWSNGPVLFDNFVINVGTNFAPMANAILMGTVTNMPVTRPSIANAGINPPTMLEYQYLSTNVVVFHDGGIIEPDGIVNYPFVSSFSQPSHGMVNANGAYLTYTAASGYIGSDSFTFIVSDGLGGLVTNTATVQVNGTAGANKFASTSNSGSNNYIMSFSGAPQCAYVLQEAGSLTSPTAWTPVFTNAANGGGLVTFTNQQAAPTGFWRTRLLP